jgi:hypothetical protein
MGHAAGLFRGDVSVEVAEVAVEIGDRLFEWAFEADHDGSPALVEEGIRAVTAYLEIYTVNGTRDRVEAAAGVAEG